jgi:hypothetical protein
MLKWSGLYQLGGFCICLTIISFKCKSLKHIEKLLFPLSLFSCNHCNSDDVWYLKIVDSLLTLQVPRPSSLFFTSPFVDNAIDGVFYESTDTYKKQYFIASDDPRVLQSERILFSVMLLATEWHVLHNSLCLHAAAISRGKKGFLFLGESGAGKSTVSTLSANLGFPVLAEDRVFVVHQNKNYLLASGPHPTTKYTNYSNLRPNLSGVFLLVKDRENYIKPLTGLESARYLYSAIIQNSASGYLSADAMGLAFRAACDVARQVRTFELHFRNNPDFWKLIDAQFPD